MPKSKAKPKKVVEARKPKAKKPRVKAKQLKLTPKKDVIDKIYNEKLLRIKGSLRPKGAIFGPNDRQRDTTIPTNNWEEKLLYLYHMLEKSKSHPPRPANQKPVSMEDVPDDRASMSTSEDAKNLPMLISDREKKPPVREKSVRPQRLKVQPKAPISKPVAIPELTSDDTADEKYSITRQLRRVIKEPKAKPEVPEANFASRNKIPTTTARNLDDLLNDAELGRLEHVRGEEAKERDRSATTTVHRSIVDNLKQISQTLSEFTVEPYLDFIPFNQVQPTPAARVQLPPEPRQAQINKFIASSFKKSRKSENQYVGGDETTDREFHGDEMIPKYLRDSVPNPPPPPVSPRKPFQRRRLERKYSFI